jgi:DNA polymerase-3 subunit delta
MDIQQVKKQIQKGEIAPIYVLYGTQKFLMDELLQEISKKVLDENTIDFNYETFDLQEHPLELAVEAAETLPFMGDKRLIVASPALFLTGAKTQNKIEHYIPSLERYLESPVDFSVLVLMVEQDKLDERKKLVKELKKKAVLCSCSSLQDQQLTPWLKERASLHCVHLDDDAAGLLGQFVGGNLQLLSNEMEKMALFVGKGGTITTTVVQDLISKTIEQDVFALVDHVVHSRIGEAFEYLYELLKRKEEPIKILFLLARQFRLIYKAKELNRRGYTQGQMAQQLGAHPYVCKLVVQQGKNYTEQQLTHILDQLAETDYSIKTGKLEKVLALEMFLLRLKQR